MCDKLLEPQVAVLSPFEVYAVNMPAIHAGNESADALAFKYLVRTMKHGEIPAATPVKLVDLDAPAGAEVPGQASLRERRDKFRQWLSRLSIIDSLNVPLWSGAADGERQVASQAIAQFGAHTLIEEAMSEAADQAPSRYSYAIYPSDIVEVAYDAKLQNA